MGTHKSLTIGVYLEVDVEIGEKIEKYLVSPRTEREFRFGSSKFCPDSGMSLIEKERVYKEYIIPSLFDVNDRYNWFEDDLFFQPNYVYGGGNHGVIMHNMESKYSRSYDDTIAVPVLENWKELVEEFKKEFKEHIQALKEMYGSCHVRYGTVYHTG